MGVFLEIKFYGSTYTQFLISTHIDTTTLEEDSAHQLCGLV
jgi:hypothetical protein